MLWVVAGILTRPSPTLKKLSCNPECYRASAAAVFTIVCLVSVLHSVTGWYEPGYGGDYGDIGSRLLAHAVFCANVVFQNFMIIATIFWIGGRYGTSQKFKDVFPVLAYCLIPVAIAAVVIPAGMHVLDLPSFMYSDGVEANEDLSPSYALDFAGGSFIVLVQNSFTTFFLVWTFALFVKATKTSRGFGTGKSIKVVLLAAAATYALMVAVNGLTGILLHLTLF